MLHIQTPYIYTNVKCTSSITTPTTHSCAHMHIHSLLPNYSDKDTLRRTHPFSPQPQHTKILIRTPHTHSSPFKLLQTNTYRCSNTVTFLWTFTHIDVFWNIPPHNHLPHTRTYIQVYTQIYIFPWHHPYPPPTHTCSSTNIYSSLHTPATMKWTHSHTIRIPTNHNPTHTHPYMLTFIHSYLHSASPAASIYTDTITIPYTSKGMHTLIYTHRYISASYSRPLHTCTRIHTLVPEPPPQTDQRWRERNSANMGC